MAEEKTLVDKKGYHRLSVSGPSVGALDGTRTAAGTENSESDYGPCF